MLNTKNILITLILGLSLVACGPQESHVITNFKETHVLEKSLHFDASTLRMINLQQDAAFNKMAKDIKKLDFYQVSKDNFDAVEKQHLQSDLEAASFENWMTVENFGMNLTILGKDKSRAPELVALIEQDSSYYVIDMLGIFNLAKIPEIWSSFQSEQFINVFNLQNGKKSRKAP